MRWKRTHRPWLGTNVYRLEFESEACEQGPRTSRQLHLLLLVPVKLDTPPLCTVSFVSRFAHQVRRETLHEDFTQEHIRYRHCLWFVQQISLEPFREFHTMLLVQQFASVIKVSSSLDPCRLNFTG